jgi:hypothetical protein
MATAAEEPASASEATLEQVAEAVPTLEAAPDPEAEPAQSHAPAVLPVTTEPDVVDVLPEPSPESAQDPEIDATLPEPPNKRPRCDQEEPVPPAAVEDGAIEKPATVLTPAVDVLRSEADVVPTPILLQGVPRGMSSLGAAAEAAVVHAKAHAAEDTPGDTPADAFLGRQPSTASQGMEAASAEPVLAAAPELSTTTAERAAEVSQDAEAAGPHARQAGTVGGTCTAEDGPLVADAYMLPEADLDEPNVETAPKDSSHANGAGTPAPAEQVATGTEASQKDSAPVDGAGDSAPAEPAATSTEAGEKDSSADAADAPAPAEPVAPSTNASEKEDSIMADASDASAPTVPVAANTEAPEPPSTAAPVIETPDVAVAGTTQQTPSDSSPATSGSPATHAASKEPIMVFDAEDAVNDLVPVVSYDDKKTMFTKDGRWILPKRQQFPTIFSALQVRVRIEKLPPTDAEGVVCQPRGMPLTHVEAILRSDVGFGKSLLRWDDARDGKLDPKTGVADPKDSLDAPREILAAINGDLPPEQQAGTETKVERWGLMVKVVSCSETCDDSAPERIMSVAKNLKEFEDHDSLVFELPQLWIIADKEFSAKNASIGLYPGSFWMGFFKSWGAVQTAEVFFRTVTHKSNEPMVHLLVKYRDQSSLKMCYTFLHERYLMHPKMRNELRQPWCRLVSFQEFRGKALGGPKAAKSAPKAKSKPKPGPKVPGPKPQPAEPKDPKSAPAKAAQPVVLAPTTKASSMVSTTKASSVTTGQATPITPKKAEPPKQLAPMTPMPKVSSATPATGTAPPETPPPPDFEAVDRAGQQRVHAKAAVSVVEGAQAGVAGSAMSPAEAMRGLAGKQLEAFQMAMSRMERLERENQELMQILLQMQGLLQQQQRRTARITQMATVGSNAVASGGQPQQTQAQQQTPWTPQPGQPQLQQQQQHALQRQGASAFQAAMLPLQSVPAKATVPTPVGFRIGESTSDALATPSTPMPEAVHAMGRLQKRKASTPEVIQPDGTLAPTGLVDELEMTEAGDPDAEAPWKHQRKRARRPVRTSNWAKGDVSGGESGGAAQGPASRGLAAYHDALLGGV